MEKAKKDIITRLRRIEGQVKGIQKMIENGSDCTDVLVQIAAIRAAINKVGGVVLENYSTSCVTKVANSEDSQEEIKKLIDTIVKFTK
ncbi:MAG: metal-sensitive transcriptional regulator [Clostridium sp.]